MRLPEDFIENSLDSVSQGAVIAEHQGICPEGTRLPTKEDFSNLLALKVDIRSKYVEDDYKGNYTADAGEDEVGFSLIYAGYCGDEDDCVSEESWSKVNLQTMLLGSDAVYADLSWYNSGLFETKVSRNYDYGSIRCIVEK